MSSISDAAEHEFWEVRDRVFAERKEGILERREQELERYTSIRKFTWLPGDIEIVSPSRGDEAE